MEKLEPAQWAMLAAAFLHSFFVFGEMVPWDRPFILRLVMSKRGIHVDKKDRFSELTATIVHNAGIYNVIITAGFLWSIFPGRVWMPTEPAAVGAIRSFFSCGAILAGVWGVSLSPWTLLQVVVGAIGLAVSLRPL